MTPPYDTDTLPTGDVMRLSPLVSRVLAPNPSPFTYTGTQSYVVGERDVAVIDPGPVDDSHVDALMAAVEGRPVLAIMCTHTHRDHSPAAALLSRLLSAPVIGCAPLMMKDDGPRADAAFDADYSPDAILTDGELVSGNGWTLEALETPGHTSNHLCFALHQEQALFTGDHVMGWSTSVISPPDGDMTAYMQSMQKLLDREHDVIYYPAHGEPVERPQRLVRGMMGHRKHREGQILRHINASPDGARIADMVRDMYKGVDEKLHPAASRSILAHLFDLQSRGLSYHQEGDLWKGMSQ